jgi:hypothetical protein
MEHKPAKNKDERHNENRKPKKPEIPDFVDEDNLYISETIKNMNNEQDIGRYGNKKWCTNCGDEWSIIGEDGLCPECFQEYHGLF